MIVIVLVSLIMSIPTPGKVPAPVVPCTKLCPAAVSSRIRGFRELGSEHEVGGQGRRSKTTLSSAEVTRCSGRDADVQRSS